MHQPLFALIDCNDFFVSCETVFQPGLKGKPAVVASSGDGCVVARSQEAKDLGIPMGIPLFKIRHLLKKPHVARLDAPLGADEETQRAVQKGTVSENRRPATTRSAKSIGRVPSSAREQANATSSVEVFSANFELYGDMSRRITEILTTITHRMEVYSIDESFLDISHLDIQDYTEWARVVRQKIEQWTGITVSMGIASTKTLAKLASERAKKDLENGGVLHIAEENRTEQLVKTRLEDIWGIGWRSGPKLRALGMSTALDIAKLTPQQGRSLLRSVHGERLVRELNGQSCLPLEQIKLGAQMASATRTFGKDTDQMHVLEAAVASFAARSAHRLRTHNLRTKRIGIFLQSNRHKPNFQSAWREIKLAQPTADTGFLTALATQLMTEAYKKGILYHRAGVTLYDLEPNKGLQTDLLGHIDVTGHERENRRMQALDHLNDKYGRRTLHFASEDLSRSWEPQKHHASPRYTTNWDELPRIIIKI